MYWPAIPDRRLLRVAAVLMPWWAAAASADSIRLLEEAASEGPQILLSHVAELDGPVIAKWGAVEVAHFTNNADHTFVTVAAIRRILAVRQINLAAVSIRGHDRCRVTRSTTARTVAEAEHSAPLLANSEVGLDLKSSVTVRDHLVNALVNLVGLPRHELQIQLSPADEQVLARSGMGEQFEFDPGVGPLLGKLSITVRRYRGDRVVETFQVRPLVTRRLLVVATTEKVRRGQIFTRGNTEVREVALDRDRGKTVSRLRDLIGKVARVTLPVGSVVYVQHSRQPYLVKRNEIITVRCINGGLVLRTTVRAIEDGSMDDVISVYNERAFIEAGRSRRNRAEATFLVRVTGPREGVVVSDGSETGVGPSLTPRRHRYVEGSRTG